MSISRRHFLKNSVSGAAIGSLTAAQFSSVLAASKSTKEWTVGTQINPSIDNKKVVCCNDPAMMTEDSSSAATFSAQNEAVISAKVDENMDAMVQKLSGKTTSADAWSTVFQKPVGKEWNQVQAAVKVNCINTAMMPHVAIVGKVCVELIARGVTASHITIYDACHNASGNGKFTPYVGNGIPEGVVVSSTTKDGENIEVGGSTMKCTSVVTGCDILINCAINKGHSQTNKGGFTLTMKNHTGTMKYSCPSLTQMIDQNKCATLVGGEVPRQQLCIVDCLWSAKKGPGGSASHLTHRIVMGTFGPLVDVAVAKKIREPVMEATHNESAITTILESFGYSESDIAYDEFTPGITRAQPAFSHSKVQETFMFRFRDSTGKTGKTGFALPHNTTTDIDIFNTAGQNVRSYRNVTTVGGQFFWDGRSGSGMGVTRGRYIVRIQPSFGRSEQAMIVF